MPTLPPSITAAPTPAPQRNDRSTFPGRVDAFITWVTTAVGEFTAVATNVYSNAVSAYNSAVSASASETSATASALTAVNAPGTSATSASTMTIGLGSQTITIQTGKSLVPGMYVVIADATAPATNSISGQITSYNAGTGVLTIIATSLKGIGTLSNWVVSLTAGGDWATKVNNLGNETISGTKTFSTTPILPAQSYVRVVNSNGYGSINTAIRRFTSIASQQGSDITYTDSATLGASFTINASKVYTMFFEDNFNAAAWFGISANSSQLTTPANLVNTADRLSAKTCQYPNTPESQCISMYLLAGTVIRPHGDGTPTGASHSGFTITASY